MLYITLPLHLHETKFEDSRTLLSEDFLYFLGKTFSARIQFPDSGWFPFLLLFPSGSLLKSEGTSEEFIESPVYPIYNPLYGSFPPVFWSPSERQKTFYNFWEKHSRPGFHFQTRLGFLLRSQFLLSSFWRQKELLNNLSRSFYVKKDLQNQPIGVL